MLSATVKLKPADACALQIEQSEESDQGKYECVATNGAGTRYSAPANLYVRVRRVPPRFSIPPTNHEIMPGGSVNITCVAVGSPMPYVKWMLGAEDLTPEDDMPIGRNVLELTDVRQSANYTCVAMSTLGVIEAVSQITVKGETCADSSDVFLFAAGRGRQPIDIRLSVMAVTRRGLPIESITGAEALVESCGDGEPQKKKRATEQSISSSRGETLGSPVYER
ncbi:UNVERIFIED_CONTAM: hypothetical protein FKN15_076601 [Acipenser sinensis]